VWHAPHQLGVRAPRVALRLPGTWRLVSREPPQTPGGVRPSADATWVRLFCGEGLPVARSAARGHTRTHPDTAPDAAGRLGSGLRWRPSILAWTRPQLRCACGASGWQGVPGRVTAGEPDVSSCSGRPGPVPGRECAVNAEVWCSAVFRRPDRAHVLPRCTGLPRCGASGIPAKRVSGDGTGGLLPVSRHSDPPHSQGAAPIRHRRASRSRRRCPVCGRAGDGRLGWCPLVMG
jgi:hypothetical protein